MNTPASGRGRLATPTALLATAALVAAGVTTGLVLAPQRMPGSVGAVPAGAGGFPVTTQVFDDARPVSVAPVLSAGATVRVADSGRVTRWDCAPGVQVASGTSPLTVDDRRLLALATSTPLWRDLGPGAKGEDVAALQTELARLGHPVTADGTFGPSTRLAVQAMQREHLGQTRPTGLLPVTSVVWLTAPSVTIASCPVRVGDPTADGVLATVEGTLESLHLAQAAADAAPGDRLLQFRGLTAPVDADGQVSDPAFLEAVRQSPEFRFTVQEGGAAAAAPLTLESVLAVPLDVAVVPPGSLFDLIGATGCVVADGSATTVTVVASSLGQTFVTFDDGIVPHAVALTAQANGPTCR